MGARLTDLGEFLLDAGRRTREAGVWDCATFPAAWAVECGLPDLFAGWRGTYSTEAEALRVAEAGGGLAEIFGAVFRSVGVEEVAPADCIAGDIGVAQVAGHQAGTIFTGERWAFVANRGLAFARLEAGEIVRAWRVAPHG